MFIRTAPLSMSLKGSSGAPIKKYKARQPPKKYMRSISIFGQPAWCSQGTSNKAGGLKQQFPAFRSKSKYREQDRIGSERHLCEADGKAWSGASLTPYPAHDPDVLTGGSSRHLRSADR